MTIGARKVSASLGVKNMDLNQWKLKILALDPAAVGTYSDMWRQQGLKYSQIFRKAVDLFEANGQAPPDLGTWDEVLYESDSLGSYFGREGGASEPLQNRN